MTSESNMLVPVPIQQPIVPSPVKKGKKRSKQLQQAQSLAGGMVSDGNGYSSGHGIGEAGKETALQTVGIDYDRVWAEYVSYKSAVPCCGGIILNEAADKVCSFNLCIVIVP